MTDVTPDFTPTSFAISNDRGEIVVTGKVPRSMVDVQPVPAGGTLVLGEAEIDKDYIVNGAITPRPANPTTLSGMKLLNVPNPSSVSIDGVNPQQVTDGEVDFSFTQPGTYTVVVSSWPALDATFQVTQA